MRMPITSIPSIIGDIAKSLGVEPTSLGILTTIPLICFGLFAPVVSMISRRLGTELAIGIGLFLLMIGSYLRIVNQPMLFVGTILAGIAITFINVLLPAVITDNMPKRIGLMTSLYTLSMAFFSSFGSGLSAPLAEQTSWQFVVEILSVVALVSFILWLPNLRFNHVDRATSTEKHQSMWRNKNAWLILLFFGFSSFIFYTCVAWLPTIATDAGLSTNTASLLAGLFQLSSIPTSFIMPMIAVKMHNRAKIIFWSALFEFIGIALLLFQVKSVLYFVLINIILGLSTAATFSITMTLFGLKTHNPKQTGDLSGMAQFGSYLIAAVGPVLTGSLQEMTHSWVASLVLMLIVTALFATLGMRSEKEEFVVAEK